MCLIPRIHGFLNQDDGVCARCGALESCVVHKHCLKYSSLLYAVFQPTKSSRPKEGDLQRNCASIRSPSCSRNPGEARANRPDGLGCSSCASACSFFSEQETPHLSASGTMYFCPYPCLAPSPAPWKRHPEPFEPTCVHQAFRIFLFRPFPAHLCPAHPFSSHMPCFVQRRELCSLEKGEPFRHFPPCRPSGLDLYSTQKQLLAAPALKAHPTWQEAQNHDMNPCRTCCHHPPGSRTH